MKEDRLSNLALIYIHKDVEIKVEEVIDRFAAKIEDSILFNFLYFLIANKSLLKFFFTPPQENPRSAPDCMISISGVWNCKISISVYGGQPGLGLNLRLEIQFHHVLNYFEDRLL